MRNERKKTNLTVALNMAVTIIILQECTMRQETPEKSKYLNLFTHSSCRCTSTAKKGEMERERDSFSYQLTLSGH